MQNTIGRIPGGSAVTRGFVILVLFFFGVFVFELFSGEAVGVPAKRSEQPMRYWIVLAIQAGASIFFVALFYFLTH
jgi:hypothetical protein